MDAHAAFAQIAKQRLAVASEMLGHAIRVCLALSCSMLGHSLLLPRDIVLSLRVRAGAHTTHCGPLLLEREREVSLFG